MSQGLSIGLILPALPGYSETFIHSKINGLLHHGFKVSLFVAGKGDLKSIPVTVPVYFQININNKLCLFSTLITSFILHPLICIRFIKLEKSSHGNWIRGFKNLIINSHIIGKNLDWLHFGFATTALWRENLASAMGIKAAVSLRGFDIGLYPHQHPNCYNLLWQKIDKVHTISDDLYQKAVDLGLDPKIPYEKITPAINIEFFKSNIDKDLHNPLRILTVGRLTWIKGYEYALKALVLLKNAQINFEYHIVGEGHYREAIMYSIYQLGLTKNVMFTGQNSPVEVKNEMEWADIYIQPSIQEGFCNAVLEAQAMGLLCIVTDADGLSENVLDGKTGWVVPKRSPEELSKKIINILTMDDDRLNQIRKYAAKRVINEFNLEFQSQLFRDFYY